MGYLKLKNEACDGAVKLKKQRPGLGGLCKNAEWGSACWQHIINYKRIGKQQQKPQDAPETIAGVKLKGKRKDVQSGKQDTTSTTSVHSIQNNIKAKVGDFLFKTHRKKFIHKLKKLIKSDRKSKDTNESLYIEVIQKSPNIELNTALWNYLGKGDEMQDIRLRFEGPLRGTTPTSSPIHQQNINNNNVVGNSPFRQRPANLYTKTNHNQNMINSNENFINNNNSTSSKLIMDRSTTSHKVNSNDCDNSKGSSSNGGDDDDDEDDNNSNLIKLKTINSNFHMANSPSSEEDNSPTEMNNCRRIIDKPPLVKRLTMGLLLKSAEDSRPLVYNNTNLNNNNYSSSKGSSHTICDGYVNEGICDPDRHISSKFGDSCRQSLMSVHQMDNSRTIDQHQEFNFKKNFLRETSSANSSPKIFHNSLRSSDHLSFQEQQELKGAAWFQAGIPREISLEVLSKRNVGEFLVRQSTSKPGCFALSLRVPPPSPKVAHYLILKTPRGYKIKGFTKEFTSLRALITHHSVMPELLPVPLSLPRPQNVTPPRRDLDDIDNTYGSLNDFRKMMADLNV